MKYKLLQFISYFLVLSLVIGVIAQGPPIDIPDYTVGGDNIQVETDALVVKVVGGQNVPFYFFWDAQDDTTKYMVMFDAIFEANDVDGDGVYDLDEDTPYGDTHMALPALKWNFSEVTTDDDGSIHFDMTSDDGLIQLKNHLYADQESQMKFDVILDGYTFANEDAILVVAFKINVEGGDDSTDQEGDTVNFGDGFFEIEETATDDSGNIDVGLFTGSEEGDSKLYMSYGHFSGKLVHDPTIGIDGGAGDTDQILEVLPLGISKGLLVVTTFIATVMAIAIPTLIYKTRSMKKQ